MKKLIIPLVMPLSTILIIMALVLFTTAGTEEMTANASGISGGQDIVEVARSQVGNTGGEPYWSWYGFNSRVEWCACFVSWCANECGYIDSGIIPKYASCSAGVSWFKDKNEWRDNSYTPKAGDIVFFDWDGDGDPDHTGIVASAENDCIQTIEGNTSSSDWSNGDCCEIKIRRTAYVLGYGTPAYPVPDVELGNGTTEEQVYTYLRSRGYSKAAACGILGNMYQESGVDPYSCADDPSSPSAGICQWESYRDKNGRWKALSDYAASKGKPWTDLKMQLEFLVWEIEGGESTCVYLMNKNYGGIGAFKTATSPAWAAEAFEKCFERAGIPRLEKRIAKAEEYYKRFD